MTKLIRTKQGYKTPEQWQEIVDQGLSNNTRIKQANIYNTNPGAEAHNTNTEQIEEQDKNPNTIDHKSKFTKAGDSIKAWLKRITNR